MNRLLDEIPLFTMFPKLRKHLPRTRLMAGFTPVEQLQKTGITGGKPAVWVKRDDQTALPYGGNKPRKLEFILADAKQCGCRTLLTVGGIGSNHCLATAIYGGIKGFRVRLLLLPQPEDEYVKANRSAMARSGAELILGKSYKDVSQVLAALEAEEPDTYHIPAGGSSILGVIGFINAGLELSWQVRHGHLPEFSKLYIPAGTCGTMAGLILGLKFSSLKTRVLGVRVVDSHIANREKVIHLLSKTLNYIRDRDSSIPGVEIDSLDFEIREGYFGEGYGHTTVRGKKAMEIMSSDENLHLDPTYTSKAMAALLDDIPSHQSQVLFWNSYSGPIQGSGCASAGV